MADPVGLIASLITITAVVNEGVKHVKALYRTPEELKVLQEQIEGFSRLICQIHEQEDVYPCSAVALILSKAKLTLERLEQIIQVKLVKSANGTSRVRRRAWMKNKGRICSLLNALKEYRQDLTIVISSKNLLSAGKSEGALNTISKQFEHSDLAAASLDSQLIAMQRILVNTHNAVMSQTTSINCIMESVSLGRKGPVPTVEEVSALPFRSNQHHDPEASDDKTSRNRRQAGVDTGRNNLSETNAEVQEPAQSSRQYLNCFRETMDEITAPAPTTLIDTSRSFFPETYTVDQRLPRSFLVVVSSYEQGSKLDSKKNLYRLLYMKDVRQWCRLNVSIEIPRSSAYWAAASTSRGELKTRETNILVAGTSLPCSLLGKVQAYLEKAMFFDENVNMHLVLSQQDASVVECQQDDTEMHARPRLLRTPSMDALTFLDDLGCPHYCQQEVVQIELLDPPNRFLSCVSGNLVFETMFARVVPSSELLYTIRVLNCLKDHPAFAKLVGIVTNRSRTQLKSYLIEFPVTQSRLEHKMRDPCISWQRRERWARQLVEGVSQVHSKGYVVGNLLSLWVPVVIDESDCVQFWFFKQKFSVGKLDGSYYPPEFLHLRFGSATLDEADCPNITSKTDIYHLGLLLWLLAENKPRTHKDAACIRQQCNKHNSCVEDHVGRFTLPYLPETVPKYYRDLVNACRAENFAERPAARNLLKRFPRLDEPLFRRAEKPTLEGTGLKGLGKGLEGTIACDACGRDNIAESFFHCNVCKTSDFDICHSCYTTGAHCYQEDHLLVEMKKVGGWKVPWRYHSKIQSLGHRDIFEL